MLPGSLTEAEKLWQQMFLSRLQSMAPGQDLHTEFLDPGQLQLAESLLKQADHLGFTAYGGYGGARRVCLNIFPSCRGGKLPPVSCVKVTGIRNPTGINPGEVRGEIIRLGILREQLGDVVTLSENELVVFTVNQVAPVICHRLTGVRGCPVQCTEIDPAGLTLLSRSSKQISGTVASLRLDAVLSLGFKLSRSRAALVITGGLVKVNWRAVSSPAARVEEGDQILLAGQGELKVLAVTGKTRKGRLGLMLTKFS